MGFFFTKYIILIHYFVFWLKKVLSPASLCSGTKFQHWEVTWGKSAECKPCCYWLNFARISPNHQPDTYLRAAALFLQGESSAPAQHWSSPCPSWASFQGPGILLLQRVIFLSPSWLLAVTSQVLNGIFFFFLGSRFTAFFIFFFFLVLIWLCFTFSVIWEVLPKFKLSLTPRRMVFGVAVWRAGWMLWLVENLPCAEVF